MSKCRPTSIFSECSLCQMSQNNCYDSQGHWENSSTVGMSVQMSPAVTRGGPPDLFEKTVCSIKFTFIYWSLENSAQRPPPFHLRYLRTSSSDISGPVPVLLDLWVLLKEHLLTTGVESKRSEIPQGLQPRSLLLKSVCSSLKIYLW